MTEDTRRSAETPGGEQPVEPGETGSGEAGGEQVETDEEQKNGFRGFVDGTARIAVGVGSTLGAAFKGLAGVFTGRNNVVMVRVNDESLGRIDQLVEAGIFRSRSESAAFLIARGAAAEAELFEKINEKVAEINRLRDELKGMMGVEQSE